MRTARTAIFIQTIFVILMALGCLIPSKSNPPTIISCKYKHYEPCEIWVNKETIQMTFFVPFFSNTKRRIIEVEEAARMHSITEVWNLVEFRFDFCPNQGSIGMPKPDKVAAEIISNIQIIKTSVVKNGIFFSARVAYPNLKELVLETQDKYSKCPQS